MRQIEQTIKENKKDNSLFEDYGFTARDARKYPVISRILKQLTPEMIEKVKDDCPGGLTRQ
jgi:hypothetical protein